VTTQTQHLWDGNHRPVKGAGWSRLSNILKTGLLLAAMSALLLGVGQMIGGPQGLLIAGVLVLAMNFGSYWFSDTLALKMNGARELGVDELPWLHEMVERLSARAQMPKPRVYIMEVPMANAFATGRSPKHAAVAVTTGLMQILDRRELEGVVAHELGHVKNRDTLISTVAATIAGVISYTAQMAFWFAGSLLGRGDDEEGGLGGALSLVGLMIVAPLTATLLQLAVSRSREFGADAAGAELCGDPDALASALSKLERGAERMPMDQSPATAHLFIVNPLSGKALMKLFSTHPPTEERVRRLHALAGRPV
jgi:heat shock protein HtpX